jgi:hypothetical protein
VKDKEGTILYTLCALGCVLGSQYDGGYSYIKTEAQVAWYEQNIKAISALRYGRDSGGVVKSMLFTHTPVPEVVTAWKSAWNDGEPNENYFYGELLSGKSTLNGYLGQDTLFQKAVELQSTKAMFFGHYHDNGFSVEYEGIRLTAGQMTTNNMDYRIGSALSGLLYASFDFRRLITYGDDRGGTKITLSSSGGFSVSPIYAREVLQDYNTRYSPDYEAVYVALEARGIDAVR